MARSRLTWAACDDQAVEVQERRRSGDVVGLVGHRAVRTLFDVAPTSGPVFSVASAAVGVANESQRRLLLAVAVRRCRRA